MTLVYISVRRITEIGEDDDILANMEFSGSTWMDALDAAYAWLKINRRADCAYHVFC